LLWYFSPIRAQVFLACSFFRVAPQNSVHLCCLPIRATCPTHPITLYSVNSTDHEAAFSQFSPVSFYCLSLSQHPVWNTLCRCSSRPILNTEPKTGLRKLRFHLDASGYWSTPLARHGYTWPVQSDGLKLPFVLKATRSRDSSATGRNIQQCQGTSLGCNSTAVSSSGREPPSSVEVKNECSCVETRWVRRSSRSLSPLYGGGYLQSRTADRGCLCDLDLGEGLTTYLRNQQVPKRHNFMAG
jgi:hypothetical protein